MKAFLRNSYVTRQWYHNGSGGTQQYLQSSQSWANIVSQNNKRNRNVWSPYQLLIREVGGGLMDQRTNIEWNGSTYSFGPNGNFFGTGSSHPAPTYLQSDLRAVTRAKLLSRLKDARNQWQAAVSLGESRETARMFAVTAGRMVGGLRMLRQGRVFDAWDTLATSSRRKYQHLKSVERELKTGSKDASAAFLELSYGWLPLLSDIDSAAKYLARKHVEQKLGLTEFSVAHRIEQSGYYQEPLNPKSAPSYGQYWHDFGHSRLTYQLIPDPYRGFANTVDELGFTDPLSVLWELTPLSFVADWFVNVGQILSSLHEFRRWTVVKGVESFRLGHVKVRVVSHYPTASFGTPYGSARTQAFSNPEILRSNLLLRSPVSSLPTSVPLRVNLNPFDLKNGQVASALALLRQAFR